MFLQNNHDADNGAFASLQELRDDLIKNFTTAIRAADKDMTISPQEQITKKKFLVAKLLNIEDALDDFLQVHHDLKTNPHLVEVAIQRENDRHVRQSAVLKFVTEPSNPQLLNKFVAALQLEPITSDEHSTLKLTENIASDPQLLDKFASALELERAISKEPIQNVVSKNFCRQRLLNANVIDDKNLFGECEKHCDPQLADQMSSECNNTLATYDTFNATKFHSNCEEFKQIGIQAENACKAFTERCTGVQNCNEEKKHFDHVVNILHSEKTCPPHQTFDRFKCVNRARHNVQDFYDLWRIDPSYNPFDLIISLSNPVMIAIKQHITNYFQTNYVLKVSKRTAMDAAVAANELLLALQYVRKLTKQIDMEQTSDNVVLWLREHALQAATQMHMECKTKCTKDVINACTKEIPYNEIDLQRICKIYISTDDQLQNELVQKLADTRKLLEVEEDEVVAHDFFD